VSWKLLLDENVSPSLARRLNHLGVDAYHVRDRGLSGAADHVVWRRASEEGRILVTINLRDFVRLARRSGLHAGIVTFPSGCTPAEQFTLIEGALTFLDTEAAQGRDAINRWLELDRDGSIRIHDVQRPGRQE
jgi:predicted nuclease of predicted toxin-antitoxin system